MGTHIRHKATRACSVDMFVAHGLVVKHPYLPEDILKHHGLHDGSLHFPKEKSSVLVVFRDDDVTIAINDVTVELV